MTVASIWRMWAASLLTFALVACAEVALVLPAHPNAQLFFGCEARAPVAECSPSAGAVKINRAWSF